MTIRVYLASTFRLGERLDIVKQELESRCIKVPDVWWKVNLKENLPTNPNTFYNHPQVRSIAKRHWRNIEEFDAFVLVGDADRVLRMTGANVELGYALAHNIPYYSVGEIKLSAMYEGVIHCEDILMLIDSLRILDNQPPEV